MAGISTGTSLLQVSSTRLIEELTDFWEFQSGSFTSYRGESANTNGVTTTIGLDGDTNGAALYNGTEGDYCYLHNTSGGISIVAWVSATNPSALVWGDAGNNTTASGYRAGYRIDNKTFVSKDSGLSANTFSLPAHTLPSGNNGFNFLALNFVTTSYPSQTFTLYNGDGSILIQSTQNFASISSGRIRFVTWGTPSFIENGKLDKVCSFKRPLSVEEITFLYNSGSGRTISQIENF